MVIFQYFFNFVRIRMNTIAAISTAPGIGGIGIVRISGEDTFKILDKVFIPK